MLHQDAPDTICLSSAHDVTRAHTFLCLLSSANVLFMPEFYFPAFIKFCPLIRPFSRARSPFNDLSAHLRIYDRELLRPVLRRVMIRYVA